MFHLHSPVSEFYVKTFRNTLSVPSLYSDVSEHPFCSTFIGSVSRKNNQDENVGVFIREKVWFEKNSSYLHRL